MGEQGLKYRHLVLGTALSTMIACGQPGVKERLRCTLAADGTAEITFEVSFPEPVAESQAEDDASPPVDR